MLPGSACPGVSSPSVREGVQGQAGPGATEEILIIADEGRHGDHQQEGDGGVEEKFWRALGRGHGEKLAHGLVLWESCCSAEMLWPRGTGATSVVSGLPVAHQA